jgi:hypothetical protein
MAISVGRLAPRAIVLAVVGYCVWPSASALFSQPETKPPETLPDITAAMLSPALSPSPTRDPFGGAAVVPWLAAKQPGAAAGKTAGKGGPAKPPVSAAGKTAGKSPHSGSAKTPDKPADPLGGLALDATCIVGDRRLAMINGRMYAVQETLRTGNSATPPYKVVDVLPYKVVLERDGKTLELTYSDIASHAASSASVGAKSAGSSHAKSGGSSRSTKKKN